MSAALEPLLMALISVSGRVAFPEVELRAIVSGKGNNSKQLKAYNLCDGTRTQGEVAKELKLDSGNFSRTVARWIETGVLFRLGTGKDATLLHLYQLPAQAKRGAR